MSKWKFLTLKEAELEFIDGDRGVNYPKKSELLPEGDCVFLNTGNVRQNSFDFSNLDFITKEKDNLLRNGKLQRDDIVLTTRGTVGNVALYSQEVPFSNIRINSGMVIIRVNKNFWHPYFIYLFFQSHLFKKQISRLISGSAQPQLPISILVTVNIPQLTLDEQKEIIFNIKSIDQKIQINNQINQELEAMAKTLYDYWFVQFDFPDQNGKPYKSSGGKMVYNPELKREIPEGWGVESVGNLLDKVTKAEKIENNSIEFIGEIPVIDQSQKYIAGFTNNENAILQPQDGHVIFGDHTRVVKYINFDYARGADGTQVLISNNENISNVLLYHMIEDFDLSNYGYARHFKFLKEKTVIVPDKEVSSKFETQANVIYEKIKNNIFENQELTQLRDWLLPMLMNGQVRVEDKTWKL
ncbi:restriction endonuclease subunit S [Streptococcus parasuis]|uniref:restriction endonuclease subunit S n=1 Tax=Streptococcus parasuis TaxID=1501662 RepID=UPI00289D8354|nr:restriction endonuclease subunit S [Streptococcus parasuis]